MKDHTAVFKKEILTFVCHALFKTMTSIKLDETRHEAIRFPCRWARFTKSNVDWQRPVLRIGSRVYMMRGSIRCRISTVIGVSVMRNVAQKWWIRRICWWVEQRECTE